MEIPWQTYTKLQDSLNKVNLINANMQFILSDGNCVDGLLGDFVFDRDNLFLHLKDVSVNNDKLSEHTLMGMHISRWRIRELAPSIDNKASSSSIFSRATFCENGEKASKLSCNGRFVNLAVFVFLETINLQFFYLVFQIKSPLINHCSVVQPHFSRKRKKSQRMEVICPFATRKLI